MKMQDFWHPSIFNLWIWNIHTYTVLPIQIHQTPFPRKESFSGILGVPVALHLLIDPLWFMIVNELAEVLEKEIVSPTKRLYLVRVCQKLQNNSSTCNKILKQFNNDDVWIGEHYLFAALSQREQFIIKQSRGAKMQRIRKGRSWIWPALGSRLLLRLAGHKFQHDLDC